MNGGHLLAAAGASSVAAVLTLPADGEEPPSRIALESLPTAAHAEAAAAPSSSASPAEGLLAAVTDGSTWGLVLASACLLAAAYGTLLGAALLLFSPTKVARRVDGSEEGAAILTELTRHEVCDQAVARVLQIAGIGGAVLATWTSLQAASRPLGLVLLAFAAIVVAGVLPARLAELRAEDVLLSSRGALRPLRWLLLAATWPARICTEGVLRLAGIQARDEKDRAALAEEIIAAVGDTSDEGGIEEERRDWIEAIVQIRDLSAGEIKTPRTDVVAFDEEQPMVDAIREAVKAGYSRFPVYRGTLDRVVGVFYVKDALGLLGASSKRDEFRTVGELMRQPYFVPESFGVLDLLREFRARKVQLAILLDEYGGTAGLVSIEDILEEIFGEIADEHDTDEEEEVRVIAPGIVEVSGRARVEDVNDELGSDLVPPGDGEYETVAGYVISQLDRIPKAGETVQTDGLAFEILDADDRRIARMRLRAEPIGSSPEAAAEHRGHG